MVNSDQSNPEDQLRSPIRPQGEDPQRNRIMPSVPRPVVPGASSQDQPPSTQLDEATRPESVAKALKRLRQKMAVVAQEYAEGKLNRAQFAAIYHRYQEQRQITERLLERDPDSGAWRSVIKPGHTSFLREHNEAHVESYAIYHLETGTQIVRTGHLQIPIEQVAPIIVRLQQIVDDGNPPKPAGRRLPNRRWCLFMPGIYALSVVIFSREPATLQVTNISDIHQDFERANQEMLRQSTYDGKGMVFPHRALFEV